VIKATITVKLKPGVLDPQGEAVKKALHTLGFDEVSDLRIGKTMEVWLSADDPAQAEERVQAMCEKLLANPVIETYSFSVEEGL
jgi:phosphoribosylformylglycinamidine synthase PurS subunit